MIEKRIAGNLLVLLVATVACISIARQIVSGPGPPLFEWTLPYTLRPANLSNYTHPASLLGREDYARLVDITDFTFGVLNRVCANSSVLVLVLVHSSPGNFLKRRAIRETWGGGREGVRLVFLVGGVADERVRELLRLEVMAYSDLVQGSFRDAYRNMTYKHVMSLKYAVYHCPQARYVLKTDDDIFVNTPTLLGFLGSDLSPYGADNLLMCVLMRDARVLRSYRSKWRVSFREYPDRKYPPYCIGWAVLYSPDVLFALYREAQIARYFWIDDVHVTGILAEKAGVNHTDVRPLVVPLKDVDAVLERADREDFRGFLYAGPNLREAQIRRLWNLSERYVSDKTALKLLKS